MRPTASPKVGPDAGDCLSDELMVELMEGRLSEEQLARAHRHAAQCNDCRSLLATVVRGGLALQGAPPATKEQFPEESTFTMMEGAGRRDNRAPREAPPASNSWSPPLQFDEFRLVRQLGRGGMGVVYLARDTSLERFVAVKFIASEQPTRWVRAYFESEARAIARLQHPNVVTVFRVGAIEGHAFTVSEYVVGQSLAELPRPVPWRRVLTLGLGLARGLAAAHRHGVLHRDIKPSNALVTQAGEVKLLDFGLAERFDHDAVSLPWDAPIFAGTPRYMAPELLGGAPATPQSDIYALGLVLHELCTGRLPRAQEELLARFSRRAPAQEPGDEPAPAGFPEGMDPDFTTLIHQCLAPNPSERFASTERVCEHLERLEKSNASAPLATGNPYRGLASFEASHRELFFGRDDDIRAVLERLQRQPLVLVAGDSGVGKSSLCRAGVLPRVAAGELDQGREYSTVTFCPGRRPLQSLAAALAPLLHRKEADIFEAFSSTPTGFGQALREAYQGRHSLLLFIDQLEELITLAEPEQAERFALLMGELALPSAGVRVLLAVRGDFLTRVCVLPGLGDGAERGLYVLRPLSAEGVREAIVGPARGQGVVFESDELIQTLVSSTAQGAGSLPLLQFALAELWERHDRVQGRITRMALEEMGGVAGALSRHADGVLARLDPAEQQAARRLLPRLVTAEGTRGEREFGTAGDAATDAALRALVEGRLLHASTAAGGARYQIAHDSLLTSWGTLRNWLDNDIGHRAVRQRLEAASAEWERLSRPREALWSQLQLDEARPLDPSTLGVRERVFLLASSRVARLQRWGRRLSLLLVLLAPAVIYGALRLQEYLADVRFVSARLQEAREALAEGRTLGTRVHARREEALARFDDRLPASSSFAVLSDPQDSRTVAEQHWREVLALLEQAEGAYVRATRSLERALERGRAQGQARPLLLEATYEHMLLAESFHQQGAREEMRQRLEHLIEDAGEGAASWRQRVLARAELELVTEPPGARGVLERYVSDAQGEARGEPVSAFGPTPLPPTPLPVGSYLLRVTRPGRAPVVLPLQLTRGGRERIHLVLPEAVPEGHVYIPPGCFLLGSADPEQVRGFMRAAPLHRVCLGEGYLIGRTEVTFQDWLEYLDTLPPGAEARRILEQPRFSAAGAITLRQQPGGGWIFSFLRSNDIVLTASEGEPILYPGRHVRHRVDWRKLPLTGVSAEDLQGYFYWLDQSGRLPGARLCNELEWERAARGADGRTFPHGDRLEPDDVNMDVTYGRKSTSFGPDEVGAHPASASPFGLLDMAGNAFELTRPATADLGRIVLRGGAWYYDQFGARVANRTAGDPTQRDVLIGVRVCASFTPRP
ncbi:bifunctional serine/threonine-protein kinase/formylglycine-generating enzyme family protein [Cystobacter ferrugineus]|uniref:bifunctional serine/threonine-protein kinase/formylglycine-generating enzyme family protein n=1 Tax=Cystobacter ferrugineus TaxID=83449 RepID=UPI001FEAEB76|nr:bifunctional serine/threonine-protein kinase/formylglycine-generating enzyme family protein [Cystobacter ferrugineus]